MKLYNGVSFQLLFRVSCHRCSFGNNKKLTSLLLRLERALVFPEEEGMMQQSSVSISLSF